MKYTTIFSAILFFVIASASAQTGHEGHNHEGHNHDGDTHEGHDHPWSNPDLPKAETMQQSPSVIQSSFQWAEAIHDFGKIKQGTPVTATFSFTNIGKEPIVITDAKASCGCTVPEYSNEAVPPGASGSVKAIYNAANVGAFSKDITIVANVSAVDIKLRITGEVVE